MNATPLIHKENVVNPCQNEIILYQPDSTVEIEVRLENENIWLTQAQISLAYGCLRGAA